MAKLFVEDVIVKKLRGGKYQFGLVVTNYETYDSSDEYSDHGGHSEPPKECERINAGQVRVAWYPKGNEEIVDDSKVTLYDRSLMPGDVVYSLTEGSGAQCGFVRSVNILCHVRIFKSKQMIYDVNSRDLNQLMEFQHGDHVVLGFWLGTIRDVSSELVIKLQNGARYVVTDEGASKLTDVHDNSEEFSVFNDQDGYYPGQVLHGPSSVFKKARWLSGTKPIMGSKTNFRGTVEKVKVTSVEVQWQTRGLCLNESINDDELFKAPDKIIEGDQLKELQVLQHFKAASVQIGDKAMYTVKTEQVVHPQHVALGSLYCFKQPEPTQKVVGRQFQKQHPQEKVSVERFTESGASSNEERKQLTEKLDKFEALKLSDDEQEFTLENLEEHFDSEKEDTKKTLQHQEGNEKEGTLISEEHGVSAVENNDEEKCAEASAGIKEMSDAKGESKVANVDLGLLCEIHQQLLEASDDIAKIGGIFKPLISKESGEAAEHMEQHIVKLLQSRNELHEQVALIEGLISGKNEMPVEKEKDASCKAVEGHPNVSHQKTGATRVLKLRPGRHKKQPVTAGEEVCVDVTHTSTVVDVTWQNGTTEKNIRSSQLSPLNQMDELEFFPGDFVLQSENIEEGVYGLITSANHQDRTCTVRWYKRPLQQEPSIPEYTHTAETSVYDLMPHTDFAFSTGDIVVRVGDTRQDGLHKLLPCAGQVLWMNTDGTIEVVWVDSTQSVALPQDLYKLDEDSDSDWSDNEDDDGKWHLDNHSIEGTESSWETASEGSEDGASITSSSREQQTSIVDEHNEKNINSNGDTLPIEGEPPAAEAKINKNTEMNSQLLNETTQPSTSADELQQSQSVDSQKTEDSSGKIQTESANIILPDAIDIDEVNLNIPVSEGVVTQSGESTLARQKCDDVQYAECGKAAIACSSEHSEQLNKLVTVESIPVNHAFYPCVFLPTAPKRFISAVKKEINLLQCSLPAGILVKAFEDRMDLFSVLIEGPKNTPYEDALFYFDVRLPADYPGVPPLLHYHSYCTRRLNPNLYEDGKVCISLLGTWTGKHNEMWNSKSTLLQVLVSIQGLILVAEPYYNEAGFEKHQGSSLGEENSRMYNEMTVLKVVQSMTRMLLNPSSVFKDEVIDFCRKHNANLIKRIECWLEADETPPSRNPDLPAFPLFPFSKGFLLSIRQALEAYKSALTQVLST